MVRVCSMAIAALMSIAVLVYAEEPLPAFPGAEGWGAVASGGRGGKVVHVTTLADSGPGSLREAIQTQGPRIIVFDVGGTIQLKSNLFFNPRDEEYRKLIKAVDEQERARLVEQWNAGRKGYGNVTFAGQTAPGGITIVGGEFGVCRFADNMIFRHIRGRGCHNTAGYHEDHHSIQIWQSRRVIVDHCSFTGGIDEVVGGNGASVFTFQWSTIEEPAKWGQGGAQHEERMHNKAILVAHNNPIDTSFHHNFIAHSPDRNPLIMSSQMEIRNNVVYDGPGATMGDYSRPEVFANVIGNTFRASPGTPIVRPFIMSILRAAKALNMYAQDNQLETLTETVTVNNPWNELPKLNNPNIRWSEEIVPMQAPLKVAFPGKTHSAAEAYELVLAKAGAWPRDVTTRRCVQECKDRTGDMGLGGPYEQFAPRNDGPTSAKNDTDRDGMPDAWEKVHGLDPSNPADGNKIVPKGASEGDRHAGYTYVEFYLNELADAIVGKDDDPKCTVAVLAADHGDVYCTHSGWTLRWGSPDLPEEVPFGGPQVVHKGSRVEVNAVPVPGYRFAHWSAPASARREGGKINGETEPGIAVIADADVTVTAHFEPNPDYGKPVVKTYEAGGLRAEVKLMTYAGDFARSTHGQALALDSEGNLIAGVGDGQFDSQLLRFDPSSGKTEDLGGVQAALPEAIRGKQNHGRIQAQPFVASDGTVYFASHYGMFHHSVYPSGGCLFKCAPGGRIEALGSVAAAAGASYYDLLGDDKRGKLYAITSLVQSPWRFLVYDIAAGTWTDKQQVRYSMSGSFPPRSMIQDAKGNVYVLAESKDGKIGTLRYDVAKDVVERIESAPTTTVYFSSGPRKGEVKREVAVNWNQAATADGDTAYFVSKVIVKGRWDFVLFRAKLSDWPNFKYEDLGSFDPEGRLLASDNLSVTPDGKYVLMAGKCIENRKSPFDGIWVYETAAGRKTLLADITDQVVESFDDPHARPLFNTYTGRNVVAKDGTIYAAVRKGKDSFWAARSDVRLMAIQISSAGE